MQNHYKIRIRILGCRLAQGYIGRLPILSEHQTSNRPLAQKWHLHEPRAQQGIRPERSFAPSGTPRPPRLEAALARPFPKRDATDQLMAHDQRDSEVAE